MICGSDYINNALELTKLINDLKEKYDGRDYIVTKVRN